MEKERRKAFWGVQVKYTLSGLLWLYGGLFVGIIGLFCYNWFAGVRVVEGEVTLLLQLKALPLGAVFFLMVIGTQAILLIGFYRQERNKLAMKRLLLPEETRDFIRYIYSVLVTFGAFVVYFLLLCVLLVLENLFSPATAFGVAELYPAFYTFPHLYFFYPVANGWAVPALIVTVLAISPFAQQYSSAREKRDIFYIYLLGIALYEFADCILDEERIDSLLWFAIPALVLLVKYCVAYRRRQKDDRAELV